MDQLPLAYTIDQFALSREPGIDRIIELACADFVNYFRVPDVLPARSHHNPYGTEVLSNRVETLNLKVTGERLTYPSLDTIPPPKLLKEEQDAVADKYKDEFLHAITLLRNPNVKERTSQVQKLVAPELKLDKLRRANCLCNMVWVTVFTTHEELRPKYEDEIKAYLKARLALGFRYQRAIC